MEPNLEFIEQDHSLLKMSMKNYTLMTITSIYLSLGKHMVRLGFSFMSRKV